VNFKKFYISNYVGAGIVFITPENNILLLKKTNKKWTFPGGHAEKNETPEQTAIRECFEELGNNIPITNFKGQPLILEKKSKPLYSFFMDVEEPFTPKLSKEHIDFKWVNVKDIKQKQLTSVFAKHWSKYVNRLGL